MSFIRLRHDCMMEALIIYAATEPKKLPDISNNSGAARAYGCLSPSFSWLESGTRCRGAFSLYWDSNAFALELILMNVDL
jgi:hypothetical protein